MKRDRHQRRARVVRADVITADGEARSIGNFRQPPPKQPGQHRWVATTMYFLTPGQARSQTVGGAVKLDTSNLMALAVGCIDCETEYDTAVDHPCPAGDEWEPSA